MKKTIVCATALCSLGINSLVFAGVMGSVLSSAKIFKGLYFGVGAGYDQTQVDFEYQQLNFDGTTYFNNLTSKQGMATYHGLIGNSNSYGRFYLAQEVSLGTFSKSIYNLSSSGDSTLQELSVKQNLDLTASVLVGFNAFKSTLIYGKAGLGAEEFDVKTTDTNPTVIPALVSRTLWAPEWLLGVGFEQKIAKGISMRLAYQYEQLAPFTGPVAGTANFAAGTLYNAHEHCYTVRNNIVMLDAIWRSTSL